MAPSHRGLKSENKSIDDPLRLVGRAEKAGTTVEMGCDAFTLTVPVAATVQRYACIVLDSTSEAVDSSSESIREWREIGLSKLQRLEHVYAFADKKF